MDVFEFAMNMEKEGEAYYRELAEQCPSNLLKNVFLFLAQDEKNHYEILQNLKSQTAVPDFETRVLTNAKNIFAQIREREPNFDFETSDLGLYKRALLIETQSERFYREKAAEEIDPCIQEVFLKIADEEAAHTYLIESIIEFIQQPREWLESGELESLDEFQ